jgi:hypothetical protein
MGDAILAPVCRLTRIDTALALEFLSFPENEKALFETGLEKLSLPAFKGEGRPSKNSPAV